MSTVVQTIQSEDQIPTSSPGSEAEGESNKELARRLIEEGFSKGNLDVVDEIVAPEQKEHQFVGPNHPDGPKGVKELIRSCHTLFPDFTLTIEDMVAVGDKVWIRATGRGTHGGEFLGRPPTGRKAVVQVIDICRFENSKLVEHWGIPDRFHMMIQLGLIAMQQ